MSVDSRFLNAMKTVLERELEGFQSIEECQQLTAGASQETYRLRVKTDQGENRYAFRRSPTSENGAPIPGQVGLATEAKLLQLAEKAGIPVPGVVYLLEDSDELGSGFLMQWLDGETLGQRIVRSEALAGIRPQLARQCGDVLARLHAIEIDETTAANLPTVTPEALVQETWDAYRVLDIPVPMIDFAARWLLENLPQNTRRTLVHEIGRAHV